MGAAVAGAGAGVNIFSALKEGEAEKKVSEFNAAVLEKEAVAAEEKAEFDEELHRERVRQALSRQRAQIGASGIDVSGSAALGLEESAKAGEVDALAIRHAGEIDAARARGGAALERVRGREAKLAGRIGAGASLLTAGSRLKGR